MSGTPATSDSATSLFTISRSNEPADESKESSAGSSNDKKGKNKAVPFTGE